MSFLELFNHYNWEEVKNSIYAKTATDVELALHKKEKRTVEDFKSLISPAALPVLEEMATLSHQLTQKRFGNTIQMYIPLYLSNECQNICTYCGFSLDNKIKRITLTDEEILKEVEIIKSFGYDHVLLVTGEANKTVGMNYFERVLKIIRPYFSHISLEVQPLETEEYEQLISLGVNTVLIYQETYHQKNYAQYHPKGKKSDFEHRLETPDRLGKAGVHKIGLGCLIGLEDWRTDSFFTALHLRYLEKKYWETKYSISFPRLRPHASPDIIPPLQLERRLWGEAMREKELVQLICAYRIFDEEVELSISTRENQNFRNNIIKLGITSMSAGSKTNPGGYSITGNSLEQFVIADERTTSEVATAIKNQGYEPVWKDWDSILG